MSPILRSLMLVVSLSLIAGCAGLGASNPTPPPTVSPTPTPAPSATLQNSVNHIIIMAQENRSFDHYFGHLPQYWQANGFPQATNGTTLDGEPATASNVGNSTTPGQPGPTITAFHLITQCVTNLSPSWNESHVDYNLHSPTSTTYLGDGYAFSAGKESSAGADTTGARAMGFYTGDDLNYYYFMASSFATSDRFFSPEMSRTQPNRMYMLGATSGGHVYPLGPTTGGQLTSKPIVQLLDENGITWKDYVHPSSTTNCSTPTCLMAQSYLHQFTYAQTIMSKEPQNLQTTDQFITDAKNGTLPQVAFIDPASESGLDEHPTEGTGGVDVQAGAQFVSTLVNTLMSGPSWKDSIFILTWDEAGGFFDHVAPQPAVNPDGISPTDLQPTDVCQTGNTSNPDCHFQTTGFRLPVIVISPFTKKNFVSHTVMDTTATLKLIETRFNLPSLTARDAAQPDMTEFFDFVNIPWKTPPTPPAQNMGGPCYLDHLP